MRNDHTATQLSDPPTLLATPLGSDTADAPMPLPDGSPGLLARVAFCFAWLFGLEPFLSGSADGEGRGKPEDRQG